MKYTKSLGLMKWIVMFCICFGFMTNIAYAEEIKEINQEDTLVEVEDHAEESKALDKTGWQEISEGKIRYYLDNGTYVKNGWKEITDTWYYFTKNGYVKTGWLEIESGKYYLTESGEIGDVGAMVSGWQKIDGKYYYFQTAGNVEGAMVSGWQKIGKYWYYFNENENYGALYTGWLERNGQIYYLKKSGGLGKKGRMLEGWKKVGGQLYYFRKSGSTEGSLFRGKQKIGNHWYYFNPEGELGSVGIIQTGWQKIDGILYYFTLEGTAGELGKMFTGWQQIDGQTFYFDCEEESKGKLVTGWLQDGSNIFYLKKTGSIGTKGKMFTGWQQIGKKTFYFKKTGDVKGKMLTGFQTVGKKQYYFKKTGDLGVKGEKFTGWQTISKKRYYFGDDGVLRTNTTVDGVVLGADGAAVDNGKTLKGLLQTALQPIDSALYVLGGGHGEAAAKIGINLSWKKHFDKQTSAYESTWSSVTNRNKGLDCSGYVGWVVYNTIYDTDGKGSCSTVSYQTPGLYKNKGWGSYKTGYKSGDFKVGDVVAWRSGNTGHTWIVLGKCSDGSYVVLHSTPASGAQLTGTMTKSGKIDSQAAALAKKYMNKYYSAKVKKMTTFPSIGAREYVFGPGSDGLYRFSWDLSGSKALSDPDGYAKKSADEILKDLF